MLMHSSNHCYSGNCQLFVSVLVFLQFLLTVSIVKILSVAHKCSYGECELWSPIRTKGRVRKFCPILTGLGVCTDLKRKKPQSVELEARRWLRTRWTGRRKDVKPISNFCYYSKAPKLQYLNLSVHPISQNAERYDTAAKNKIVHCLPDVQLLM